MLHISQVRVPVESLLCASPPEDVRRGRIGGEETLLVRKAAAKLLRIDAEKIRGFEIVRKSMDARRGRQMCYIYQVLLTCAGEERIARRHAKNDVQWTPGEIPVQDDRVPAVAGRRERPLIAGFGPAGIFAALELARAGFAPIVLERGDEVDRRQAQVDAFWQGGELNPESNVQFGEGGAGAFSDGKLNTMVRDPAGRNRKVLRILAEFGAPSEILYLQKPHVGTDRLKDVVKAVRGEIISLGGEVWFGTKLQDIVVSGGELRAVKLSKGGVERELPCSRLILATGHSARDTFSNLHRTGIFMEPKAFAVGVRVEHPQEMIGRNQYGELYHRLPAADYKLTCQTSGGRGVYSFCMCPGGYVVNASSEPGRLAVNGMSYYDRDGVNANSAIVATVTPADFGGTGALAGVEFQRRYEEAAFRQAQGKIPVQLCGDFLRGVASTSFGAVVPQMRGLYGFGNLREILPAEIGDAIAEAMGMFGGRLKGYDREDAVMSGVESRTSSPVRIVRDGSMQSNIRGVYPCGEGAGYAGGIMSAAMDGLRTADAIIGEG